MSNMSQIDTINMDNLADVDLGLDFSVLEASKFKRLGDEFFNLNGTKQLELDAFMKQIEKYNLLKLPVGLNEFFLDYAYPPLSFIKEYYLINELSKKSHELRNLTFSNKKLEGFFLKWVLSQNSEGRLYYAKSIFNSLKDDHSKAINMLVLAFILSYENALQDYDAALNLFIRVLNLFDKSKSDSKIRDRILYLVNIFAGFTELRKYSLKDAYDRFQNAFQYNKWSVNAKFYSSLAKIQMEDPDTAINYLDDVINYDEMRISFAITSNNYLLLKYFLKNSFIQNVFSFKEFSVLSDYFQEILNGKKDAGAISLKEILLKTEGLNRKQAAKYLKESNRKELVFIEKLLKDYKTSTHFYIMSSFTILEQKLNNIINSIIKNIEDNYNSKLEEHKKLYEDKLTAESIRIAELEESIRQAHEKLENEFEQRRKSFEREIDARIRTLETMQENLENRKNEVSMRSFTNSMFYNIFISAFVALTGGFAEFTNSSVVETSSFASTFSTILIRGMKWGLLSFIIGLVTSVFASLSSVVNLYTKKQKLIKQINQANTQKMKIKSIIENELESAKEKVTTNTMILINNHRKTLERLKIERDRRIGDLEKETKEMIGKEVAQFQELID